MPDQPIPPAVKAARDLTEIVAMTAALHDQAIDDANQHIDGRSLPGGNAMIALAPVGNLAIWEGRYEGHEHRNRIVHPDRAIDLTHIDDEDDTWEPPLQTLRYWSDQWRRAHNADWDHIPTIATEAHFLRWLIDNGAIDIDHPDWNHFTRDIRRARLRLEDVVHDGHRPERTRIVCDRCDTAPRLIHHRGSLDDGSEDSWKCTACKHRFDRDELSKAHAKMLRSDGAEKWVHQADAIGTLKAQGRSERTVRQWLSEGEGEAYCDPTTHEVWVWWPDLWRRHLVTPTRQRRTA